MKPERKEKVFIRHEIMKMFDNGHTDEQIMAMVREKFAKGEITLDDIIEWLVHSRRNDIKFKRDLEKIKEVVDGILF